MRHAEKMKLVPVLSDLDLNTAAVSSGDSINMKGFHHCTFVVFFGTLGGDATFIECHSGASDAALTSILTFRYAFGGAATGTALCDVLATAAESTSLEVDEAVYSNYMLVIEVDASDMDIANGEEWLTISFSDDDTGSTGLVSVLAILDPRYKSESSATALT
jgi:hypothetical protein